MKLRLKTKKRLMYAGVVICVAGMIPAFVVSNWPAWATAVVVAVGAAMVLGCAWLASEHKYLEGEEEREADKEISYQSLGMASGMCLGAAVSALVVDNAAVGMPVGMIIGFLVGSLIKKK